MRITSNTISRNLLANIERAQNRMHNLENQISSAKKINKPSDDPKAVERMLYLKSGLSRIDQWKRNVEQAIDLANNTDSIMGNMTAMLQRARELAVQGASDSLSQNERLTIKAEIDQIAQELLTSANIKVAGKPVFAGTKTDKDPLDSLGATWEGNDEAINFEVGNGVTIPVNVDGVALFTTKPDGTLGIFETLEKLSQALGNNDGTVVSDSLKDLDANLDNINILRADLGARVNRLTAIQSQLETTETNMLQSLSLIEDTDMVKAIFDFKDQQKVFEAAMSTGAQIIQMSLVDFIR